MKIIEPKVELWKQEDPIAHVAKCARVCYGNAVSKGEEADKRLYDSLKKSGHLSMFRHESVYAIVPYGYESFTSHLINYSTCPYIEMQLDNSKEPNWYIVTNRNFLLDYVDKAYVHSLYRLDYAIEKFQVTPEEFAQTRLGRSMMRYTFHITTQISTSRELNRVSPNNIAERSTRYVRELGVICRPHWMNKALAEEFNEGYGIGPFSAMTPSEDVYIGATLKAFEAYKALLKSGLSREDARGVLPLDTATEVIYTYSVDEWKHIISLRSDKRAHPNCNIIAGLIKKELENLGYDF